MADLNEIQYLLYNNIRQTTVSYSQYLGNGTNREGRQQIYFLVRDLTGRERVMVVCVSDDIFQPMPETLPDRRPVRLIITVFFMPYDNHFKKNIFIEKTFK